MPRSIFWPTMLVVAGVLLLFANFNLIHVSAWELIGAGWPLLLIVAGLDLLLSAVRRDRGSGVRRDE